MKLRTRDSDKIRVGALSMATKKINSGCSSCGDAYLHLALRHGATDDDIATARARPRLYVPERRDGLGALAMGAATVAPPAAPPLNDDRVAQKLEQLLHPKPPRKRVGDPFGVDGSTSQSSGTQLGMPLNFYIGELGCSTSMSCGPCGGPCFRTDSANYVGVQYTYGYWGLEGPDTTDKGGLSDYAWGQAQADAFMNAYWNGPYWSYVYGQTFFADIEAGFGGWTNYNYTPNASVLDGFINKIQYWGHYYRLTFNTGVYININDINGPNKYYFSSSYVTVRPVVFWVTGDQTCVPCAPCATNCNTLTDVQNRWSSTIQHACFAGNGAQLWQYWVGSCGCGGDFDYTPQGAYNLFSTGACV